MTLPPGKTQALNGLCADQACGWIWPIHFLPMEMRTAAELMKAARCPACGSKKVLLGPSSPGA